MNRDTPITDAFEAEHKDCSLDASYPAALEKCRILEVALNNARLDIMILLKSSNAYNEVNLELTRRVASMSRTIRQFGDLPREKP